MNLGYVQILRALLPFFEIVSDFKVNLSKFKMVLVGPVRNMRSLANILGCQVSSLQIRYLRFPLGLWARAVWDGVIEKVERRLVGWKMLYLSKGKKITIIKNTLLIFPLTFYLCFPFQLVWLIIWKRFFETSRGEVLGRKSSFI